MHTFGADEPYVKWHTILNGGWMVSSAKNSASPGTKSRRTRALRWARLAWTPGDSPLKHGYNFTVFTHTSCGKGVTIWCLIVLDMFLAVALYSTAEKKEGKRKGPHSSPWIRRLAGRSPWLLATWRQDKAPSLPFPLFAPLPHPGRRKLAPWPWLVLSGPD